VVCSVGTITTTGSVTIIPFTNTYTAVNEALTSELVALVHADWLWKVVIVIGSDRNLFGVGFYPGSAALALGTNYVGEYASPKF
jgi:hypothetical protein